MPNLLDLVETSSSQILENQHQSDLNLSKSLRSICFFKYDSLDLCKILAMSGRPLKTDPTETVFGSLDLLNLNNSPLLVQNILETEFGAADLKTILMLANNEAMESIIT